MKTENKESRMIELTESFGQRNEIYLKSKAKKDSSIKLAEEKKRMLTLLSPKTNDVFKEASQGFGFSGNGDQFNTGRNKTVTTIIDDLNKDNAGNRVKASKVPLQSDEAFEIAIKRTLKSGAPINNISFYDEVNWQLMGLGFSTQNPIDIKNMIAKMLELK